MALPPAQTAREPITTAPTPRIVRGVDARPLRKTPAGALAARSTPPTSRRAELKLGDHIKPAAATAAA